MQGVENPPSNGDSAPRLPVVQDTEKPVLVVFLRHTGCPFAERTVKQLNRWAATHLDVEVVCIGHGDPLVFKHWLSLIDSGGNLNVYVDEARSYYGQWGLGYTRLTHFVNIPTLIKVLGLAFKGIRNRVASGTRWQSAGVFLVVGGKVVWQHRPHYAHAFALPHVKVWREKTDANL